MLLNGFQALHEQGFFLEWRRSSLRLREANCQFVRRPT